MARLGSEDGSLKLDWVEGVARLLEDPTRLNEIEAEEREIWERGIRHIIWSGMGGSIIAVRVLSDLGFCSGHDGERIAIYPLDSTDPAALNEIVRKIAWAKDITLPTKQAFPDLPGRSKRPPPYLHATPASTRTPRRRDDGRCVYGYDIGGAQHTFDMVYRIAREGTVTTQRAPPGDDASWLLS